MNKEWVDQKNREHEADIRRAKEHVRNAVINQKYMDEATKARYLSKLENLKRFYISLEFMKHDCDEDESNKEEINQWWNDIREDIDKLHMYYQYYSLPEDSGMCSRGFYNRYLDSEPMYFEGSIIITDPGYVLADRELPPSPDYRDFYTHDKPSEYDDYDPKHRRSATRDKENDAYNAAYDKWRAENPDDWEICECGSKMEALGINTYMTRDTIYGDWSCTTYNIDNKEPIGRFCADGGLVSVMLLDEVLAYNPAYTDHKEKSWTTTLIENFKGDVQFIVVRSEGIYEDTTEYHKKSDTWEDFEVQVHGHGINTVTGEPINFMTTQTGL